MNKEDLIKEFHDKLHMYRYSTDTIVNFKSVVSIFLSWASQKFTDPAEITSSDLEKYVAWLVDKKKVQYSYQRTTIAALIKFFNLVCGISMALEHLYPKGSEKSLPKYLNMDQIKRLLEACGNLKHRCIIALLYGSGLRLSELLRLNINDIDFKGSVVHIRPEKRNNGRKSILPSVIQNDLKMYHLKHKPQKYLFEGQKGGPYSKRSVQLLIKLAALKAGISKKASPNILRHSFAIHLLENGTEIRIIQELLGHQSIKTTEIYTSIANISKLKVRSPIESILI